VEHGARCPIAVKDLLGISLVEALSGLSPCGFAK